MSRIWQIRNRLLIYRVSFLFDKLGWLLKYDAESNEALQKVTYAYEKLNRCRQEGRRGSIVVWEKCASGHVDRVMSYWTDYHASAPTGELQPVARASVERYCRQRMRPLQ